MDRIENLAQTYSQAPWRKQLQFIGLFSLLLVLAALVAGVYLNVSARASAAGRQIQDMQRDITERRREIEDLQSQLARVRAAASMRSRAESMGFVPLVVDQVVYLSIPGYTGRQSVVLAPSPERALVSAPHVPPEYTESLFDWLGRNASQVVRLALEVQP